MTAASQNEELESRILIVDDDVDVASGLARLLKLLGHQTRTAHTGALALVEAMAFRPDYVLLDIGLPDMDGYQVATRLRTESCQQTVIIAITGHGQPEDLRRSREAGFSYHLVKPVDYNALVAVIGQRVR